MWSTAAWVWRDALYVCSLKLTPSHDVTPVPQGAHPLDLMLPRVHLRRIYESIKQQLAVLPFPFVCKPFTAMIERSCCFADACVMLTVSEASGTIHLTIRLQFEVHHLRYRHVIIHFFAFCMRAR